MLGWGEGQGEDAGVGKASRNERDDERSQAENGDKKLFRTSSRWTCGGEVRHPEAAGITAEVAGAAAAASRWRPRF